jgi:hypothetical protein
MTIHTEEKRGLFVVTASRGESPRFVAKASSRDRKEAYATAIDRLNKKTAGIYYPIEIYPGFVG